MILSPNEILEVHKKLVKIPSVSKCEIAIVDFVAQYLRDAGARVDVIGRNVVARRGEGPIFLLNSHLDTVPAAADWSRDPYAVESIDGRIYGLGSNDAKASVAAMIAAFLATDIKSSGMQLMLMLVCDEETGGEGTELLLPWLAKQGQRPIGAVVGEPTGLNIAASQKGMMVVELVAAAESAHSANAKSLGFRNAVWKIAADLAALEHLDLGPTDGNLGQTTLEPTVITGGLARNRTPAEVRCVLDLRTVPSTPHSDLEKRLRDAVSGEIKMTSMRLEPRACPPDAIVLQAACAARPTAKVYGSPTMSDLVFMKDWPAIKCGPGESRRSHRADEFVLESEVLDGSEFYGKLIAEVSRAIAEGESGESES